MCTTTTFSGQNTQRFQKLFTGAAESGRSILGCNSGKVLLIKLILFYRGKICSFFDKKPSKSSKFYYLEPGFYPSNTDSAETMNTLIQETQNQRENCITVKVPRRTPKIEIYHANERSGPAFFSSDLGHSFGGNVGIEIRVMLRGKGPHKSKKAYNIVRIHSLLVDTDLIKCIIVGDTKTPLLRSFPSFQSLNLETE